MPGRSFRAFLGEYGTSGLGGSTSQAGTGYAVAIVCEGAGDDDGPGWYEGCPWARIAEVLLGVI